MSIPIRSFTVIPIIIAFSLEIITPWILGLWFDYVSHDYYLSNIWNDNFPWILMMNIIPTFIGTGELVS